MPDNTGKRFSLRLPATLANLEEFRIFVTDGAVKAGMDEARIMQITLAVEEAYTNICKYAYPSDPRDAELTCDLTGERALVIELADSGAPFDITAAELPDTGIPLEDRAIGGLGGLLIREMADETQYRREGARNILRLTFRPRSGADETEKN
ncbi:MAG: ATP-binding protein [Elusimicrobiaceae bacterium]|nr:ATP-binding protein [Elusimicrobiaceae bacterium]